MRTITAIAVFLFGTTSCRSRRHRRQERSRPHGARWVTVQVLVWATILGFTAAAWGIYRSLSWWTPVLAAAAFAGIAAAGLYAFAVREVPDVANVASNVLLQAGISLALLVAVALPTVRQTFIERL